MKKVIVTNQSPEQELLDLGNIMHKLRKATKMHDTSGTPEDNEEMIHWQQQADQWLSEHIKIEQ